MSEAKYQRREPDGGSQGGGGGQDLEARGPARGRPPSRSDGVGGARIGRRLAAAGLLTATLVAAVVGRQARAAEPAPVPAPPSANAVAVLPLEIVGNVPAGRPALETAVIRGLVLVSGPTLTPTQVGARLAAAGLRPQCAEPACWAAAGRAVGARYLLSGLVERKAGQFEVEFRLLDAPSGRLLASERNRCEVADCSVAELCRMTVRELARQTLGSPESASAGVSTPSPAAGLAAAGGAAPPLATLPTPAPSAADTPPTPPLGEMKARHAPVSPRVLPAATLTAGALSVVAGAVFLKLEGDCTEHVTGEENGKRINRCNTHRRTLWAGVGLTGMGAALLGTGLYLALTGEADDGSARLSFGLDGATLSGRF